MLNTICFEDKVVCLTHHFTTDNGNFFVMGFDLLTHNQILLEFNTDHDCDGTFYYIWNRTEHIKEYESQIDAMEDIDEKTYRHCNDHARKVAYKEYLEEMEQEREKCY